MAPLKLLALRVLVAALLLPAYARGYAGSSTDLHRCTIVVGENASAQEHTAATVLVEEVARRTGLRWTLASSAPREGFAILLARHGDPMPSGSEDRLSHPSLKPEGFQIRMWKRRGDGLVIEGADSLGVLFGTGYLLRQLSMESGSAILPGGPAGVLTTQAPAYAVRGHQLGYRPKNNTFDAWSPAQFDQYIRDLAVFGTNWIELIPPRSDDAANSPLYTLPPLQMMQTLSAIIDRYGLHCSIWYPALDKDYSDPSTVDSAVKEWGEIFRALPRVDAVFVPGGDPGHTEPKYLFALLQREADELHKTHPNAQMWVSPQSFSAAWLAEFYTLLESHPRWLTGVVYGPEMRESPETFRAHVPAEYPIRFYPDITHTAASQYPVPNWNPAFALTEGREPIDPRPEDEGILFHRYAPLTTGFIAYSEGSNDDINKALWSAWGWDPTQSATGILRQYGRYFISPKSADEFASGAQDLEQNWRYSAMDNPSIDRTLRLFQHLEKHSSQSLPSNWRLQQVLYRAYYDAYIEQRAQSEGAQERQVISALRAVDPVHPDSALGKAEAALLPPSQCAHSELCQRVTSLASDLFRTVGMQLSVSRFHALAVDRGANLDSVDATITDLPWLRVRLEEAHRITAVDQQQAFLRETFDTLAPTSTDLRDDLGLPGHHPHLITGAGFAQDPSGLSGTYLGTRGPYEPKVPTPLFTQTYAGTLYDTPLQMRYTGLTPGVLYRVHVYYAADGSAYHLRANGALLSQQCLIDKPCKEATTEISSETNAEGTVVLEWSGTPGLGSNGRALKICRVFLEAGRRKDR